MAGNAEAARMREAVTVVQERIRCAAEPPQRGEGRGGFPERQQSRNVREPHRMLDDPLLDDGSCLRIPHYGGGDAEPVACANGGVEARNPTKRPLGGERPEEGREVGM